MLVSIVSVMFICSYYSVIAETPPFILSSGNGRIVGGEETTIEQHPYQVSITYMHYHSCGGSIINNRIILTAAHCTFAKEPESMKVRVGTTFVDNPNLPGVLYHVEKIIQHDGFSWLTIDNDIAIVKTIRNIYFNPQVRPIPFLPRGSDVPVNSAVTVTGWGSTEESSYEVVSNLRRVALNVLSVQECKNSYGERITQRMFCAQSPGKDACQGDSGGPVEYNGYLVGIVSWGTGCAQPYYPGVFTRIANLRSWIDQNINK